VAVLLTDAEHAYLYGIGSTPVAQVDLSDEALVDYLHGDLTGSIRTTTAADGSVTGDSDYDPYGRPTSVTGDPVSAVTPFGYAGEYTDPTGLTYLRHRYYDPTTAQFLTIDPLVDQTKSPYGYTDGNPLQYVDPLGLDWWNPTTWTKATWSNVGAGIGLAAVAVDYAAVMTGNPVLGGVGVALMGVSVAASAVGAVMECTDGGPGSACAWAVGETVLSAVGGSVAARLVKTAFTARHVAEGSRIAAQLEWGFWETGTILGRGGQLEPWRLDDGCGGGTW
jgi:RHS repeat-associated protein